MPAGGKFSTDSVTDRRLARTKPFRLLRDERGIARADGEMKSPLSDYTYFRFKSRQGFLIRKEHTVPMTMATKRTINVLK